MLYFYWLLQFRYYVMYITLLSTISLFEYGYFLIVIIIIIIIYQKHFILYRRKQ